VSPRDVETELVKSTAKTTLSANLYPTNTVVVGWSKIEQHVSKTSVLLGL
jgi:hypothetical protein